MSRFDDMVARDLETLLEDGSDLGTDAKLIPPEGGTVAIRLVWGDSADGLQAVPEGVTDNQTSPATTRTSVIADAIGRPPQHGDKILVEAGAMQGEWAIVGVQLDQGDGANLALRYERQIVASRGNRA